MHINTSLYALKSTIYYGVIIITKIAIWFIFNQVKKYCFATFYDMLT